MKNNFMNTNSTRFSEQFKKKIFLAAPGRQPPRAKGRTSLAKQSDSRHVGGPPDPLTPETNPETRRFKTLPRESKLLHEYLGHRRRVQEKVNGNYSLMCKLLRLQALSKEISNKLQRQRKNLGLLRPAKKPPAPEASAEQSVPPGMAPVLNEASVQAQLERRGSGLVDQADIEEQLKQALEKHVLKQKRSANEERPSDWRNSCPVDIPPQPLAFAVKHTFDNENRFSVQNLALLDKASTRRWGSGLADQPRLAGETAAEERAEPGYPRKAPGDERRELGLWAKEKIRSFRHPREGARPQLQRERTPKDTCAAQRAWAGEALRGLKTGKSEQKTREAALSRAKRAGAKKLVPQKRKGAKLYARSGKTLPGAGKAKKYSHKDARTQSGHQPALNLSKNISQGRREKEFWNRLGSGKLNSRMTRSFFLAKGGKSAAPAKPVKKTRSRKVLGIKSKSALKRDLFKKGSSSFGNLFSEFRANYKHLSKNTDAAPVSPGLSAKAAKKPRAGVFESKPRAKGSRPAKKKARREGCAQKPKDRRLPAISFRTMQEGKLYSKYVHARESHLEEGLNAKMLKILSKMENLKETVKAEKQKLKCSGQKTGAGANSSDFLKASRRSAKKRDGANFSTKMGPRPETGERLPNNLTFSGPQKLRQLGGVSAAKGNPPEDLAEEKRELKLTPMSEFSTREIAAPGKVPKGLFPVKKRPGAKSRKAAPEKGRKTPKQFVSPELRKPKAKPKKIKPLSRETSKVRSLKKKTSKASKSFSNLNSKNLVPRGAKHFAREQHRRMKNYLYENTGYGGKARVSNSIYQNRKAKKCYSLIGDSVRRFKTPAAGSESQKLAGNRRRLRNLVRDKSLKLMQDYSNKNLGRRRKEPVRPAPREDFSQVIEEKLRLLKTKLVHKSYEDSRAAKPNAEPKTPQKKGAEGEQGVRAEEVPELRNLEERASEGHVPAAPFNSITMREVTPRFKDEAQGKSALLKNSSLLKQKTGNAFDSDFFESTGKKGLAQSFSLAEFIRKFDPGNVFNEDDDQAPAQGSLQPFRVQSVCVHKLGGVEAVARDAALRLRVLGHLRNKYAQIMNN